MTKKDAWFLRKGDKFTLGDRTYTAAAEPTGEFNTYIQVEPNGEEIFIRDSEKVEVHP